MAVSDAQHPDEPITRPTARELTALRGNSFGTLVMLILQFSIGIVVNLYVTVPASDRGSGTFGAIGRALSNGPVALGTHAALGLLILLSALALVVRSIASRHVPTIAASLIGLLAIISAAGSGATFVSDGGKTGPSLGMALATAVAMLCYAIILFMLGTGRARQR